MKKPEFQNRMRRNGLNQESFGYLVGMRRETICGYGANGEEIPRWVTLVMRLIEERGGVSDLIRERAVCGDK